ncbi:MAG: acyl-CoA dehydrogenase family protein [Candidatus Marinimicrobia bacterium]|nr:acyl-CoA dehydrogenase family protein [Candidatus Neomarinimicrobiota bacterium]MCF7828222.1 acyl-CoA dehydrogenase family protein [Candidatus Neomarinimicrobiota bacterium]MCF7879603.1 acyl-CoA dehydrogenase family protein [Candidatus Neomarinimicrobiota bacterium]
MAKFQGVDYFKMDDHFSEEELMIRDMVRDFVDNEVIPVIEEHHREATFPMEVGGQMGELGLFGSNLPEKYGCPNLNNVAYGLIMQELERGDSGVRSFASVQGALVMYPIYEFGSEEQRQRWLPKLASGELIGCFGLTEPDYGSNPGGMKTKAVKDGDSYILNGTKMWITNGTISDVAIVWAKLDGVVRGFIVPTDAEGFSAPEMKGKFSLRASITSELIMEDVRIPAENILPEVEGLRGPLSCLTQARYGIAWGAVGSAMATYETALNYAKERIQFDKPIASFQLIQDKLVTMVTEITKGQMLVYHLGRNKDEDKMRHQMVSMAKMNNVSMALDTARTAREILGANGILDEYPVIRHMMNLESVYTYEGTHDIHRLIIGADITGIEAFV